jgi:dTDP-4-dehydrorhamnose 3,5-epimerase
VSETLGKSHLTTTTTINEQHSTNNHLRAFVVKSDFSFETSSLDGVFAVRPQIRSDERDHLVRISCDEQFEERGLNIAWVQTSLTHTLHALTLRGMHYQSGNYGEIKLIRCVSGCVWDCLLDIRPESPTYRLWQSWELSARNELGLYVPAGIAHGFLSLTPDARMLYFMSQPDAAADATGVRWDDPFAGIQWPFEPEHISEKDSALPTLA